MGVSTYPDILIPAGMLMPSARGDAPPGWLLCDGTYILRDEYPDLFTAIGTTYNIGGDADATRFRLPNLKGRTIVMQDAAQVEFDVLGEAGGSKTSTAQHTHNLASHTHTLGTHTHGYAHTHGTAAVSVDHAHNVYGRDQNTGGQSANHAHQAETEGIASDQGWPAAGHLAFRSTDRTGQLMYGGWGVKGVCTISNNSVYQDHTHNFNHDHPSTNYATQSPWAGNTGSHSHGTNSQSVSTTGGPAGGSDGPSNNTSGPSTVEVASGNLQPYLTMNYLIKT